MQGAFDTLTGLFDRVGLRKNIRKMGRMICRPCLMSGIQLEAACGWRMTGEELTYRYRKRIRVQCPEFGEELAEGFLEVN